LPARFKRFKTAIIAALFLCAGVIIVLAIALRPSGPQFDFLKGQQAHGTTQSGKSTIWYSFASNPQDIADAAHIELPLKGWNRQSSEGVDLYRKAEMSVAIMRDTAVFDTLPGGMIVSAPKPGWTTVNILDRSPGPMDRFSNWIRNLFGRK